MWCPCASYDAIVPSGARCDRRVGVRPAAVPLHVEDGGDGAVGREGHDRRSPLLPVHHHAAADHLRLGARRRHAGNGGRRRRRHGRDPRLASARREEKDGETRERGEGAHRGQSRGRVGIVDPRVPCSLLVMFESAELGHALDKHVYDRKVPKLRKELLDAQSALVEKKHFPVFDPHSRRGRRGQGRDGERAQRVDGPASHPDPRDGRAHRRGEAAAAALALLARPPAEGENRHLLRLLVHRSHPPPRVRRDQGRRARRVARRDPPLRADALRRGRPPHQVLVPPLEEAPEGAALRPRVEEEDALARHRHRLEALPPLRQLPQGVRAIAPPHQHRVRAVVRRRGFRRPLPQRDGERGAPRRRAEAPQRRRVPRAHPRAAAHARHRQQGRAHGARSPGRSSPSTATTRSSASSSSASTPSRGAPSSRSWPW